MKRKLSIMLTLLALVALVQFFTAPRTSLVGQTTQYYTGLMRRGLKANIPTLTAGEFGFTTDTRELYIGSSVGNVRIHGDYITPEMYGAKGDGTTDDTVAIQAAADALTAGQMLAFAPGKTYKTGSIWVNKSNVWIGCQGGRATLKFDDADFHYGIMVHGGTISAANRTLTYYNDTYGLTDYNNSRISGVTVENLDLISVSGAVESCFDFEWADDCAIINCSSNDSAGNGISFRFCRRPLIRKCSVVDPANYGAFVWMSRDALVEGSYFEGGDKGIELKQRYDSEPCNHRVLHNTFKNIDGPDISGGLGRLVTETAAYYISHYEIVEGCLIEGNRFIRESGETFPPGVMIGTCAEQWKVSKNEFDGGGIASAYAMQVGSSGTTGADHIEGQNHLISGNSFANMTLTRVLDVGASCEIVDNQVSALVRIFVSESTTRISDTLDISLRGNTIRSVLLATSGQGILATVSSNTKSLVVINNIVDVTPAVNSANTFSIGIYSTAVLNIIQGNYIRIQKGPATHDNCYGLMLGGAKHIVVGNYIGLDSDSAASGIYIGSGATDNQTTIADNTLEDLGTSTSTGIYAAKKVDAHGNTFVGGWDTAQNLAGGGSSLTFNGTWPVETNAALGNKIGFYPGQNWGIGFQGSLVQFINHSASGDWAFGYGTTDSLTRVMTIDAGQGLGLGTTSFGTSATNTVSVASGTAPTTSPADVTQFYSADAGGVAGQAGPHFRMEGGGVFALRSSTGTTLQYTYQKDDLADDGTVVLPDATSGMVLVSCNAEAGMWLVQSDGAVVKISGSANTDAADTDAKLCVYDSGTGATVKNRLGAAGEIRIVYYYN